MKGYKAFEADWTCRGFQYEIGKTYELPEGQKLEMCKCGFHFCKNPIDVFAYYPMDGETLIAEIEALGEILQEGTKFVTNKIRVVKEFTMDQLLALVRDDKSNTGDQNSGTYNSGSGNSGRHNSGHYNSGNYNSGNNNTGWFNSGHFNIGHYNSGNSNTGWFNSGNCNAGNYNSGGWNSGYFNSGYYNSGLFNSNEPKMRIFNQESKMTLTEFFGSIDYSFDNLCQRIYRKGLIEGDVAKIKALPNFNAEIFKEITGIDIEEVE